MSYLSPSPLIVDGALVYESAPLGDDPAYWVGFLGDLLTRRWQDSKLYDHYYRGNHRLPSGPTRAHATYRRLVEASKSNWAELVVDATAERLHVIGFRWSGAESADLEVWDDLWQTNDLDAYSEQVHTESLVWGYAYVIVWPNDDGSIRITPEHPSEVITYGPADARDTTTMALKRWLDDWGYWHVTLYTPTAIYKFVSASSVHGAGFPPRSTQWEPRANYDEPWPLPNPFGVVPVVEFPNNPRMVTGGRSELGTGAVPIIDRINETVFNRLLAANFAAFRQKWVTGMEIPRDPATGQAKEPFNTAVDRLWMSEDPDVKFGEFSEATLKNYIDAAEADIAHLASITRTPAYYLLPRGPMPSGEALKAAETGLVAKVKRRQRFFGEAWEQMLRMALLMQGDSRATDKSCETLWATPEARSDSGMGDLLVKLDQVGVPPEMLWEISGFFSPQQIERIKELKAAEPEAPPPVVLPPTPSVDTTASPEAP